MTAACAIRDNWLNPPDDEWLTSRQPLDEATALVCYTLIGGTAHVDGAYIGDCWVDRSYFADATLSRWAQAIDTERADEKEAAK